MWPRILKNVAIFVPVFWLLTSYMMPEGTFAGNLVSRIDDALIVGAIYIFIMWAFEMFKARRK